MKLVVALTALTVALGVTSPSHADAIPQDVCATLAAHLQPDVMIQGSTSQQFAEFQHILSDQRYEDLASASSANSSFNLGVSVPDIVDVAIGDNKHSNSSNWQSRRSMFLGMTYQQTSSFFQSSSYISQTSAAVVHEISQCAQTIAGTRANGVFINLDTMSPEMDSFAVQLAYRTDGNPTDWSLTDFHVQPDDPNFKCNGFEKASDGNKILLGTLRKEIGCSKTSSAHLTLVVNTSAGGGIAIPLTSIDEKLQKIRDDMDAKIAMLQTTLKNNITISLNSLGQESHENKCSWGSSYQQDCTATCQDGVAIGGSCEVGDTRGHVLTVSDFHKNGTSWTCHYLDGNNWGVNSDHSGISLTARATCFVPPK